MVAFARFLAAGIIKTLAGHEDEELEEINIPVSSTAIREIGWRSDGVITVTFHRGGTYSYGGSKELFLAFVAAPSKGAFFNANFR